MQIRMLQLSKVFYFSINFICFYSIFFVPKMKKIVTKYVVCYSNN